MKRKYVALCLLILVLLAAVIFAFVWITREMDSSINPQKGSIILEIKKGETFTSVYRRLQEKNMLTHPLLFYTLAEYYGATDRIKAGEYEINGEDTYRGLLNKLTKGGVILYRLTVPEGFNLRQITAAIAHSELETDTEAFLALVTEESYVKTLGIDAATMEGYLFPDTYYFSREVSPKIIIKTMLARFHSVFTDDLAKRASKLDLTKHEAVTLASIIQKETADVKEMPLISSVFHNRLRQGIRLQSDPTVIYGIKDFNGNLTRRDLKTKTAYNTYTMYGLPPGPISNPGKESIIAALFPAETDYLFFVSRNDGTHHFSSTLKEHNRAVYEYQKRRRRR